MPAIPHETDGLLEFGDYRIDAAQKLLMRGGDVIPLAPKVFDTLLVLATARGRVIEKNELLKRIWPETFVEEGSLARNVSTLRRILGDEGGDQKYIETIPKRGYRFVAAIRSLPREVEHPAGESVHGTGDPSASTGDLAARRSSITPWTRRIRSSAALAAVVVVVAVAGMASWSTSNRGDGPGAIRSIAVLPLRNLSSDPDDEFFADGTTESLISSLAQIHALNVTSRTSVMRYKGTVRPLGDIARELGVDAVLEGSVQRAGTRIRVTAQLIRTSTDTHLWANEYDRDARDFLQLQGDIARAVVEEIRPQITREERARLATAPRIKPEAHEAYMLGRYHHWKASQASLRNAIAYFDRAIELQPDYAAAYAGAALSWVDLYAFQDPHAEPEGRAAAEKALQIDPGTAEAHVAIASLHVNNWRWVEADEEFKKALALNPDSVDACVCYANLLGRMGRISEALTLVEHAKKVNPLATAIEWQYGVILYYARRYDEAISHLLRAIELDPQNAAASMMLARVYERAGRAADAMAILDRPEFRASAEMGVAYAMLGRRGDAEKILRDIKTGSDAVGIASLYFQLGDNDLGFEWLGKAVDQRHPLAAALKVSPRYDRVRSDRRFTALVSRLNLPE